jgi:hypothetical protein
MTKRFQLSIQYWVLWVSNVLLCHRVACSYEYRITVHTSTVLLYQDEDGNVTSESERWKGFYSMTY